MTTARRRLLTTTAALVAALACVAGPAQASPQQASMFMDDNLLLFRGDETADRTLKELKALGVDWVRVSVPWRNFAPAHDAAARPATFTDATDPKQYDPRVFDLHDHLLRVADQLGIKVLFSVTGDAPLWATGSLRGRKVNQVYKPSAAEFGKFVTMLGKRFDGKHTDENQGGGSVPRVAAWSIWNEPNQGAQLQPQWERSKKTRKWVPFAARVYRGLARAAIDALRHTGHGGDTILLGETAPRGLRVFGRTRPIRPITFLDALFCIDGRTGRSLKGRAAAELGCDYGKRGQLAVSGYAHHPYSITSAPDVPDPNPADVTLADAPRLGAVLDRAAGLHRIPAGLKYWWTEYGWQTNPPDPTPRGVPLTSQATWIAQAEKITRDDARTVALTQFLLRDDQPRDAGREEDRWDTYQTGIEDAAGQGKPSYDAYRLPLVASGSGANVALWGFIRPSGGATQPNVQLEFAPEGSSDYAPVGGAVAVDPGTRIFTAQVAPERSGTYRFSWTPPGGESKPATGLGGLLGQKPTPATTYHSVPVAVKVG